MIEFKVGQLLYYVPNKGSCQYVEIHKVSRVWIEADHKMRVSRRTLQVHGGNNHSPGQCYLSEDEYKQHNEIKRAWVAFFDRVMDYRSSLPMNITLEKINQAFTLLFGE